MRIPTHAPVDRPLLIEPEAVDEIVDPWSARPHFSWSQMWLYISCSMKYYFQYVKGMPSPTTLPMALGSGLHGALEWNARRKIQTTTDMPLADMTDLASDLIDIETAETEDGDARARGKGKDEAISAITLFRVTQAPDIMPLAAEHTFLLPIAPDDDYPDPVLPVRGYIDIVSHMARTSDVPGPTPRMVTLEDYKLSDRRKPQAEVDLTSQLDMYDMALHEQTGQLVDALGLRQFGFLQRDGPYVETTYRSHDLLDRATRLIRHERLRQKIRRIQDAIRKGVFIPTDNVQTCSKCPYRQICQYSLIKTDEPR